MQDRLALSNCLYLSNIREVDKGIETNCRICTLPSSTLSGVGQGRVAYSKVKKSPAVEVYACENLVCLYSNASVW